MLYFNYYSGQTISVKFWSIDDDTVQVGTVGGYSATASVTTTNPYRYAADPALNEVPIGNYYVTIEQPGGRAGIFVAGRISVDNWLVGDSVSSGSNISTLTFSYDGNREEEEVINVLYMESLPLTIYVSNESGDLDLTTKTLKFVVESLNKTDILTILNANISRTTDTANVTITTDVSSTIGTYRWSLRDLTSGEIVLAHGKLDVSYVARAA